MAKGPCRLEQLDRQEMNKCTSLLMSCSLHANLRYPSSILQNPKHLGLCTGACHLIPSPAKTTEKPKPGTEPLPQYKPAPRLLLDIWCWLCRHTKLAGLRKRHAQLSEGGHQAQCDTGMVDMALAVQRVLRKKAVKLQSTPRRQISLDPKVSLTPCKRQKIRGTLTRHVVRPYLGVQRMTIGGSENLAHDGIRLPPSARALNSERNIPHCLCAE